MTNNHHRYAMCTRCIKRNCRKSPAPPASEHEGWSCRDFKKHAEGFTMEEECRDKMLASVHKTIKGNDSVGRRRRRQLLDMRARRS